MPPEGVAFVPGGAAMPPPRNGAPMHPQGEGFVPPEGGAFRPPLKHMGSLANILHHFGSGWALRELPNVALFHFADYRVDLPGEMLRLAGVLGIDVTRGRAEQLAKHAALEVMRDQASDLAPDSTEGIWRSNSRFFRSGRGGEWQQFFSESQLRRYVHRINLLAPPDLLAWAHEGRRAFDPG
jgi:hypothetical protein